MRTRHSGFTLIEIAITLGILAVLFAIGGPAYSKYRVRSMQSDAKVELTSVFTIEAAFKEQYRTYHMNFPQMGLNIRNVSQTDMSSSSNPYMARLYAVSAGGPIDYTLDEAKPVTMASLGLTYTPPDPQKYTGSLQPNSSVCGVTAADSYGATGGATPTATASTLLVTAKGCPQKYINSNYDVMTIDQDGIIRQLYDVSNH